MPGHGRIWNEDQQPLEAALLFQGDEDYGGERLCFSVKMTTTTT
jgi:hypothetical protein